MVRAILDGRKTQTRRIVPEWVFAKCQRKTGLPCDMDMNGLGELREDWLLKACPYGSCGDRLWVRETWDAPPGVTDQREVMYRADNWHDDKIAHWRPSIHMPRWASRIALYVKDVRLDRVQAISDDDVRAEGAIADRGDGETWYSGKSQIIFEGLWDSINGDRAPWAKNPWVWVVTFERITP